MKLILKVSVIIIGTYFCLFCLSNYKANIYQNSELQNLEFGNFITYFILDSKVIFDKELIIRNQEEYVLLIKEFKKNNPEIQDIYTKVPQIDFSKYSIIAKGIPSNFCEFDVKTLLKVNRFRKKVWLISSYNGEGNCEGSSGFSWGYFLTPKIPDDYKVFFSVNTESISLVKRYIPFYYY